MGFCSRYFSIPVNSGINLPMSLAGSYSTFEKLSDLIGPDP